MSRRLASLLSAPWAILPTADLSFLARLNHTDRQSSLQPCSAEGIAPAEITRRRIDIGVSPDGTGVIAIHGEIVECDAEDAYWWGLVPPSMVIAAIKRQVSAGAKRIYFDIDSPGGCVIGVPELYDAIAALAAKGVVTIAGSSGLIASAAYWIASACDAIVCTRGAEVGSIGVYTVIEDWSKMAESCGVVVHMIATSPIKGAGYPGTKVTDEQLKAEQEMVDSTFALFLGDVKRKRKKLSSEAATAKVWLAEGAMARGLIDRVENPNTNINKEA